MEVVRLPRDLSQERGLGGDGGMPQNSFEDSCPSVAKHARVTWLLRCWQFVQCRACCVTWGIISASSVP
eukprot:3245591-Amphidinium_carterae.1